MLTRLAGRGSNSGPSSGRRASGSRGETLGFFAHVGGLFVVFALLMGVFVWLSVRGQLESERLAGCDYKLGEARRLVGRFDGDLARLEDRMRAEVATGVWHGAEDAARSVQTIEAQLVQRVEQVRDCRESLAGRGAAGVAELDGLEARWEALSVASLFVVRQQWHDLADLAQSEVNSYPCAGMGGFVAALRTGVLESVAGSGSLRGSDLASASMRSDGWRRALEGARLQAAAMRECAVGPGVDAAGLEAALASELAAWLDAASGLNLLQRQAAP